MTDLERAISIRSEQRADEPEIRRVNTEAFGQPNEADLVDSLRGSGRTLVSLVAVQENRIVGHILFSPVTIESDATRWTAAALGPMSVLLGHQNQGTGSMLVRRGLEECRAKGHPVVFVVGHPGFYPRFGFSSARARGFECEFDVSDDVFKVAELEIGAIRERKGRIRYPAEFHQV